MRVVVVGTGALGGEVVRRLGTAGVGEVLLVDPDVVEEKNVRMSPWFQAQAGRSKVEVVAEAARRAWPDTRWSTLDLEIADAGFGRLEKAEVLFGCVDSELARLEMAYIGTKLDLPVCDGGLGPGRGGVSWFPGREAACYGCRLTAARRRELLTTWDSPVYPCWPPGETPERASTAAVAACVAAAQVEIGLRAAPPGEAEAFEVAPAAKRERIGIPRSEACPFHRPEVHLVEAPGERIGEMLAGAAERGEGEPVLVLDWPVAVAAECLDCGGVFRPMRRVGWLRRRGVCPACGSRRVRDVETLTRIGRDSVWTGSTFRELGLPEQHLHTVRFEGP